MFTQRRLSSLFDAITDELPPGSVVAVRHMHGRNDNEFGIAGSRVTETYDERLEWAMEAMQTRGNFMLDHGVASIPRFPNAFLNAGCRVGIVGGSDHSRGEGVNSFCLTGFWVREATPAGVLEALRSRRTVAAANGKVAMHVTLEGRPMGEEIATSAPCAFTAHLSSASELRRVALMRDGEMLQWHDLDSRTATVDLCDDRVPPGRHWHCITVEGMRAFPKAPVVAHSSPFFVTVEANDAM